MTSSVEPTTQSVARCSECSIGAFTIYGPTCVKFPNRIQELRKSVLRLRPNQTLLREGETSDLVYTVYSGWAYRFHELSKSRRQILRFLIPGDPIYLSSIASQSGPARHGVRAISSVVLCVFNAADVMEILFESTEQRTRLSLELFDQFNELDRRLTDIGQRRAIGRVACFLLDLELRLRARGFVVDGAFTLPIRQEHIADALGLTHVHVNRTLAQLRRLGLIRFERGSMKILDPKGLGLAALDA
jgi:CRP-like cAMP-binding protein